ncbi:MAG: glycosyltransferase family 39 protein [Anaerolineales bacterium]|nr:glycosyltransferase family 39 protein [Anaerolineales bacterium]
MKNFLKRFSLFEVLLVAVILGIHLYASLADTYALPNVWFQRDDAYYYYKVAQNISEGNGSTFDGINLTNGYHPLWMIVCIPIFALARFDLILPLRVLLMVIAVFHAATAVLIYRLVKQYFSQAVAILAASYWAFDYYTHETVYKVGLETPIATLAVAYMLYRLSNFEHGWRKDGVTLKQMAGFGLLAAMVMFSRLDLIFLAVLLGPWLILRGKAIRHLLLPDLAVIFISITSSVILRTDFNTYNYTYATSAVEVAVLGMIVKPILLYFLGAYQHPRALPLWKTFRQIFLALAGSAVITFGIYLLLVQIGMGKDFPRTAFLLDFGISLLLIFAVRLAAHWFGSPNPAPAETPASEFKSNWKQWLTEGSVYYGIVGGLLLAYMLFNKLIFGAASPVSGQVKRWWGSIPDIIYERPPTDWFSLFGVGLGHFKILPYPITEMIWTASGWVKPILPGADKVNERFYLALLVMAGAAIFLAMLNKRVSMRAATKLGLLPLATGSLIHVLSYTATAYGGAKEWYRVSENLLVIFLGSFLIYLILKPLQKIKYSHFALVAGAVMISAVMAYNFGTAIYQIMRHGRFPADAPYMDVLDFLEENTPPGSIIGMTGGGNNGYFIKDRTIVNMDGLINSQEYFQALKVGEAATFLTDQGMTIVFLNPRLLAYPPYSRQFDPYMVRYDSYGGKDLMYLLAEPKY